MSKFLQYLIIIISVFFTSCIPSKDLIYLQKKGVTQSEAMILGVVSKPYRLQTNDIISIVVKANDPKLVAMFSVSDQSGIASRTEAGLYFDGFTVNDHGNIRIPILGELNVVGYTTDEVRTRIEKLLLSEYFNVAAHIFVIVKLAGFRYTINGEVMSTGTKTVFQDQVTIMQAIANAGDITLTGNRKSVMIIRQLPTGTVTQELDLSDANVMQSPYYYLQPNDYIYVKPLRQKTWGIGKTGIESVGTFVSLLSLATTFYLLLKK